MEEMGGLRGGERKGAEEEEEEAEGQEDGRHCRALQFVAVAV